MGQNIGPKIGVEGEQSYKKQMAAIIQQAKTLDAQMKAVTKSFDDETTAEEKVTKAGGVLQDAIDANKQKMALLRDQIEKATEKYGENATQTQKLKEQLYKAEGKEADLEKQQKELNSAVDDGTDAVEDVGDEFDDAGDKAVSFGDILKANVIGDMIIDGIKNLGSAIGDLGKKFVESFNDTITWADDLATLSTVTGVSTDKLQELEYMAGLTDTSVDTITGSLTKLTRNMDDARSGTGEAADAFRMLGIRYQTADGQLRDTDTVFGEIIDKLGQMEDGADRDALAMSIFGKSAQELNPLIETGSAQIAAFAQEAHDMGYVMGEDAINSMVGVSDSMERINNAGESMKRNLTSAFAPFVEEVANDVVPAVSDLAGSFGDLVSGNISMNEFVDLILEQARNLVSGLKENMPEILEQGKAMVDNITAGVNELLPELVPLAIDLVMTVVSAILDNLPSIIETGSLVVLELARGIGSALPDLIPSIVDCILTIVDTLTKPDMIGLVIDAAIAIMEGLIQGIIGAIPMLLERVPDIIIQFVGAILVNLPKLLESGAKMLMEVVAGILNSIPKVGEAVKKIVVAIKDALFGNGGEKFRTWGKDMIDGIVKGIKNSISKVTEAAKSVANTISGWLHFSIPDKGPLRSVPKWGGDMVDEMIRGIRNGERRLDAAVSGLAYGMVDSMGYGRGGSVTNMGGVNFTINAAPGQSEQAIADAVMQRMQRIYEGRTTVWA